MKLKLSIITLSYLLLSACGSDSSSDQPVPEQNTEDVAENPTETQTPGDTDPEASDAEVVENDSGESLFQFYESGGFAIGGTDPVAYFTVGAPTAGSDSFTYDWSGSTWKFASQENLDAFKVDPKAYAPQFGGFCAYAVSRNYTASTTPEAWNIVDGKLYLNLSLSVRSSWAEDIPGNIAAGDANWPGLRTAINP
ncbi:MAG: YHS domain-containing protein [Pseudobacteriovorax sp.]|nr:YHS domain-containing protein [Pseudobacteriovorax sp.]